MPPMTRFGNWRDFKSRSSRTKPVRTRQRRAARTPIETQLRKDLVEAFEDTGVSLAPDRRARTKAIAERLTALSQEFARNLRDNTTRMPFAPADMLGLPEGYLSRQPRDEAGNYLLSFDYPDFNPFMANAESEDARRRYYAGYLNRGSARNLEILDEVVSLRRELAELYELPSYAHFVLRRRMAETPEAVDSFLAEVKTAVDEAERRDPDEPARSRPCAVRQSAADVVVHRWDRRFLSERLREERYRVDQESLRRYFPAGPDARVAPRRQRVALRPALRRGARAGWMTTCGYFDVHDAETGAFIGGSTSTSIRAEGKFRTPRRGPCVASAEGRPHTDFGVGDELSIAGADARRVKTLFHEFGHILHGVLGDIYNFHAGTSVQRDFCRGAVANFEEWARRLESLVRLRGTSPDTPPVDAGLVGRLDAARRFGQGLLYARQWLYASFDLALTGPTPGPAMAVWERMEAASLLGHVPGTAFPGTFGHIVGGYAAGYYGYMWAEVLALDMLSAFGDDV